MIKLLFAISVVSALGIGYSFAAGPAVEDDGPKKLSVSASSDVYPEEWICIRQPARCQ